MTSVYSSQAVVLAFMVLVSMALAGPAAELRGEWHSWNGRQVCHPYMTHAPKSTEEVAKIVSAVYKEAASHGGAATLRMPIKAHGAGHSFSPAALSEGTMISMENMRDVLKVEGTQVTVQAGIQLKVLNEKLWDLGLSMKNLGAIGEQTVSGATQTGTHGTGRDIGSISTFITAVTYVNGKGDVLKASATENKDVFDAIRVGVGAIGIVTEMTVDCDPAYYLERTMTPYPLDVLLKELPVLNAKHPRMQYFWTPYTGNATLLTFTPTTKPVTGCWPTAGAVCVDRSYKALSHNLTPQSAIYTEMEMFVDVRHEAAAVQEFIAFEESIKPQHKSAVGIFNNIRYIAQDDILLSPQYGRDNIVISFIAYGGSDDADAGAEFDRYSRGLEKIALKYGARPHWGKANYFNNAQIRTAYPDTYDAFHAVRVAQDPLGLFVNDYVHSHLVDTTEQAALGLRGAPVPAVI